MPGGSDSPRVRAKAARAEGVQVLPSLECLVGEVPAAAPADAPKPLDGQHPVVVLDRVGVTTWRCVPPQG